MGGFGAGGPLTSRHWTATGSFSGRRCHMLRHAACPPGPCMAGQCIPPVLLSCTGQVCHSGDPVPHPSAQIQSERRDALSRALEKGYIENYSSNRVGFRGTRFRIEGVTLFSVSSPTGAGGGQMSMRGDGAFMSVMGTGGFVGGS